MATKPHHWASPRNIAIASAGCVLAGVIACGDEPIGSKIGPAESAATVISAAAAPSVAIAPSHGGTMVMAGTYPVEVVPHASGQVYAYVPEDALPPDDGTELSVVVPVVGGTRTVALEWDAGDRRWAGRVRRVEIAPGPLEVVVVVGETRWIGHAVTLVVLPAIIVVTPPSPVGVVVVEHEYEYEYRGKHRKHRKHRGRGRGRGRGRHGGRDVEIRFGH